MGGRVKDEHLNIKEPLVIAQLCVVTSVKKDKNRGKILGLLPVPTDGRVLEQKMVGHTNSVRFIRKFSTLLETKKIVDSQKYRNDFQTIVEQVDCVERYLTNHVGLETVPLDEVKTFREFLCLEGFDKCIYLEGLRRMKKGMSKEIPPRGDSFEESLVNEGVYDHVKGEKDIEIIVEKAVVKNKERVKTGNDSYLETLDDEMKSLVANKRDDWPLTWMKEKSEIVKLKKIMTRKKKCRRHELFMDHKQRRVRNNLPELIKISNSSFMNIFGKKRESIDRDVRIFIQEAVFDKTIKSQDVDRGLTDLFQQFKDCGRDYVELVLYPELFISWVKKERRCTFMEAESFFQRVGQVVSAEELERLGREWLEGNKNTEEEHDSEEDEEDL